MRQTVLLILVAWVATTLQAETADVVMRIGDHAVERDTFEQAYRANNQHHALTPDEFAQLYIIHTIKVLEAEQLGFDTLATFRQQMETLAKPINGATAESDQRWIHLFVYLPQSGTPQQLGSLRQLADSLHHEAQQQGSLVPYLSVYPQGSHPYVVAETLTQLPKHHTMLQVEQAMSALKPGELSDILITEAGIHLFQLTTATDLITTPQTAPEQLEQAWRAALLQQAWEQFAQSIEVDPQLLTKHLRHEMGSKRSVRQWSQNATLAEWQSRWQKLLLEQCLAKYSVEINESVLKSVNSR